MKRLLLLLTMIFSMVIADAQEGSWKIKLNNTTLLTTSKENEEKNIIKAEKWKWGNSIEIKFTEAEPDTWWRAFLFYDEDDNEIIRKDSIVTFRLAVKHLIKRFSGKKEIRIYTTISPKDPNLAIRVRRVHLCTLRLQ